MHIKNKVALVTGGANGIGFAFAKELLRNGAGRVAILDLVGSNGEDSAAKLNTEFGEDRAVFIPCDVTSPEELEAGFQKTVDAFNGLDIVINNAGIMNDAQWELMIDINVNAVVRGTLLGMKHMGKDNGGKGGTIVNAASIAGLTTYPIFPIYCGTKHAVIGLSRSFGNPYRYRKTGVRVMAICPGGTETALVDEIGDKVLDVDRNYALEFMKLVPIQKVENVAHGLVDMLGSAENGSVWVTENNEPIYEIRIPNYDAMKAPRED